MGPYAAEVLARAVRRQRMWQQAGDQASRQSSLLLEACQAKHRPARLASTTKGRISVNSCPELWPAALRAPPSLGPTIDPIRPTATAAPSPTPRISVG